MKAIYFAWVRERIGVEAEEIAPPETVATAADLIDWLVTRDEAHAFAFEDRAAIRVAIDRRHAQPGASLAGAREVAFFPPMTGG